MSLTRLLRPARSTAVPDAATSVAPTSTPEEMVGLETSEACEVNAGWYDRKPWAPRVEWRVPGSFQVAGPRWPIRYVIVIGSDGAVTRHSAMVNGKPLVLYTGDSLVVDLKGD